MSTTHDPQWSQPALFTGGYTELMIELTIHLDGPRSTVQVGYVIMDGTTREWIAADTGAQVTRLVPDAHAHVRLTEALMAAMEHLLPF